MLQAQVAELAQTKVESTTRMPVKLFGTVHAGVFANSANANWLDNPNIVAATPADGHGGTMSASLRQTRIGFTADGPTIGSARTNAVVAMDFFGGIPGFQTGQVMGLPRLLVAFARIEGARTALEVGQDHVILAPRDPTSLAAFAFPLLFRSGNLYLRAPQVRVERTFDVASARDGRHRRADRRRSAGEDYLFVPPALGGERSRRPGVQARVAYTAGEASAPRLVDIGAVGTRRLGAPRHRSGEKLGGGARFRGAARLARRRRRALRRRQRRCVRRRDRPRCAERRRVERAAAVSVRPRVVHGGRRASTASADSRRLTLARGENRTAYGSVIFSLTPGGPGVIRVPLAHDARGQQRTAQPSLRLGAGLQVLEAWS